MDKHEIYIKQIGTVVAFIELPYFNDRDITLAKKLRFHKVDEIPVIKKGITAVNQMGISDLIDPLRVKLINLLDDPAWVVVLFEAVQQELRSPTIEKK